MLRQAVENQIKIDLSGNSDFEFRQEEAPQKFSTTMLEPGT
jgi:hypothetical protein